MLYLIFQGVLWVIFYFYFFCNHIFYFQEILLCFLLHFYNRIIFFLNKKICQVQPTPVKPYGAPANYSLVSKKMNTCFCTTLSSKEVCYCHIIVIVITNTRWKYKIQKKQKRLSLRFGSQILKVSQRENKENKGGEFRKEIMQEKFPELIDKNFILKELKIKKEKERKKELNNYKNIHTGADSRFSENQE